MSISYAAPVIIQHYADRGLAMNTLDGPQLGIKRVIFREHPRPLVTVVLTDGTIERWTRTDATWRKA